MRENKLIKIILIGILILIFCTGCIVLLENWSYHSYNQKIGSHVDTKFTYKIVYKSEPGFGNDEFNICRFSLMEPKDIQEFISLDNLSNEEIENDIKNFFDTDLESDENDLDYSQFYQELSCLEKSTETKYLYHKIENDLTCELYIYNKGMNIGYYIVSIF